MSPANPGSSADNLHEALKTFLKTMSPTKIPAADRWQVGYGPNMSQYSRAPYWDFMDGQIDPNDDDRMTVVRFLYSPTGSMVNSSWISHMNYISVCFGSDWNPEYNQEDDNTVIPSSESGPTGSSRAAEKYMIGGPLCDPVVTGQVETATETVHNQFSRVKAGADLNHIFEVLAAYRTRTLTSDDYRETLPSVEDLPDDLFNESVNTTSPLRSISGIGNTTIKRFASRFGVYPNLRTVERGDLSGLLPGYDNSPDIDDMDAVITAITDHYQNLSKRADWPTVRIDADQFAEYPTGNPIDGVGI